MNDQIKYLDGISEWVVCSLNTTDDFVVHLECFLHSDFGSDGNQYLGVCYRKLEGEVRKNRFFAIHPRYTFPAARTIEKDDLPQWCSDFIMMDTLR